MPQANPRNRKQNYRNEARRSPYVEGSAARQLEEVPQRERRRQPKRTVKKRRQVKARRALIVIPIQAVSVLMLAVALIATLYVCVIYVQLQSTLSYQIHQSSNMEIELQALKIKNDEAQSRIDSYVDLDYIYQQATEVLGMAYPTKEQVELYENSGTEYARQFESIPDLSNR